jgi:hypothetical protein
MKEMAYGLPDHDGLILLPVNHVRIFFLLQMDLF